LTERTQIIMYLSFATFCVVVFIAVLLVKRQGHTIETQRILDAIEGGRQQMSAENTALQYEQRAQGSVLRKILDRLGFLK
jgi:hypothetical protein